MELLSVLLRQCKVYLTQLCFFWLMASCLLTSVFLGSLLVTRSQLNETMHRVPHVSASNELWQESSSKRGATAPLSQDWEGSRTALQTLQFSPWVCKGFSSGVREYDSLLEASMTRWVGMITWDDVPHLTQEQKTELFNSIPPYQRDARTKGIPQLGSGAIYPVPESTYVVDDFPLPKHWPRSYGLDVGWNCTAAIWGARDLESGVDYLYSCYKQGEEKPSTHAAGIRARGQWIKGVIDPAARGRGQDDGQQLIQQYRDLGLSLIPADNQVEAGIYDVWEALSAGKLKVFRTACQPWLSEVRLYRRDVKGKVVKKEDHLMDATRYWKRSGAIIATAEGRDVRKDVLRALGIGRGFDVIKEHFWVG